MRVGRPREIPGVVDESQDPSLAVVLGLIIWAFDQEHRLVSRASFNIPNIGGAVHKLREWAKTFMP